MDKFQTLSLLAITCLARTIFGSSDVELHASTSLADQGPSERQAIQSSGGRQMLAPAFRRVTIGFSTREKPGTIIIDSGARHLYFVQPDQKAIRYGIGVAQDGLEWSGTVRVGRMAEWPSWTPTQNMIRRNADYAKYASGMPGGPKNPLGARAIYLYSGARDTKYRIHGTNEPWTIGHAVSSGCIRMLNEDVIDLYDRVKSGAKVLVH